MITPITHSPFFFFTEAALWLADVLLLLALAADGI